MNSPKQIVYCDIAFLQHGLSSKSEKRDIIGTKTFIHFFDFLGKADIRLNCPLDIFAKYSEDNEIGRNLWKKRANGECKLEFDIRIPNMTAKENLCAVYFKSNDADNNSQRSLSEEYGVLEVNADKISQYGYLYVDSGPLVKKETKNSWKSILNIPGKVCNSLIIVDNYLFKPKKREEEVNLYQIIQSFLPKALSVPFHITIVTMKDSGIDWEEKERELQDYIEEVNPYLQFSLQICPCEKFDFHDRKLITNYLLMEAPAGFDLFNTRNLAKRETQLRILYPAFADFSKSAFEAYYALIKSVKKVFLKEKRRPTNRLLT